MFKTIRRIVCNGAFHLVACRLNFQRVREQVRKLVSVTKHDMNTTFTHFLVREHLCLSQVGHIFFGSAACLIKHNSNHPTLLASFVPF